MFLAQKSEPATEADKDTVQDLLDTLSAHLDHCVGMASILDGLLRLFSMSLITLQVL